MSDTLPKMKYSINQTLDEKTGDFLPENFSIESDNVEVEFSEFNFYYGNHQALQNISMQIPKKSVTAIIGPSGCGKSTLLRCINRMNDTILGTRKEGLCQIGSNDIYAPNYDLIKLRTKVGMIFQKPTAFPKSIYENVAYGPRIHKMKLTKAELDDLVEWALRKVALWDEVEGDLDKPGTSLSGGQQQRLCIARAIAIFPEIILFDEPTSALDPISSKKIEELILELRKDYSVVIVTHSLSQAARISDQIAFLYQGKLIEYNWTFNIFEHPQEERTAEYIGGAFG